MEIIHTVKEMQETVMHIRAEGLRIGFVPTMGYLHDGHLSLIRKAKKENHVCVVSIYVNPKQFLPNEDLKKYPKDFEHDEKLLRKCNVDILFYPKDKEIYPSGYETTVNVESISDVLEGVSRPGHFKGVATIVTKLFNIVHPTKAYFGQKDYQQCLVIKRLVKDLNLDLEVVMCATVREKDGLAMSSRNTYLNEEERRQAAWLYESLCHAEKRIKEGEKNAAVLKQEMQNIILKNKDAKIDYIEFVNAETLTPIGIIKQNAVVCIAVFISETRLIDNTLLKSNN